LYEHETDPNEWTNIATIENYQKIKERLKTFITHQCPEATKGIYNKTKPKVIVL